MKYVAFNSLGFSVNEDEEYIIFIADSDGRIDRFSLFDFISYLTDEVGVEFEKNVDGLYRITKESLSSNGILGVEVFQSYISEDNYSTFLDGRGIVDFKCGDIDVHGDIGLIKIRDKYYGIRGYDKFNMVLRVYTYNKNGKPVIDIQDPDKQLHTICRLDMSDGSVMAGKLFKLDMGEVKRRLLG